MNPAELLTNGIKESLRIVLDVNQLKQFELLSKLMLEYNQHVNLTRITEPSEVVKLHYLDSLSMLSHVKVATNSKIIDVGTGAGFPGLPLKIIRPDLHVTLLDSLKKRIDYLEMVISQLQLKHITTIHGRGEALSHNLMHREQYDLAVSRALASLPKLCEYCIPYLKIGGYFVAYKGRDANQEIERSHNAIIKLGGKLIDCVETSIYQSDTKHCLVVIKKIKQTPKQYPRKNAQIVKNPL